METVAIRSGGRSSAQREDELHELEGSINTAVMEGKWKVVVDIYKKNKSAPIMINQFGDTILHLVILMGDQDGAMQLMKLMEEDKGRMEDILQRKNDGGNTPLHQAAFMGMDKVCLLMAKHYCTENVVLARNKQGETPLHVAVLHGHKYAFFALQMIIERKCWKATDRKDGGDTILHSVIFRERFDLALIIIDKYPELLHYMNEVGESALHILANKPSAFKSGTFLSLFDSFIYHSIVFLPHKDIRRDYQSYKKKGRQDLQDDGIACDASWTNGEDDKSNHNTDVEIEILEGGVEQGDQVDQQNMMIQNQGISPSSPNQHRFLEYQKLFFKYDINPVLKAIVFLFLPIGKVQEIRLMKKKHLYAYMIMKQLVSGAKGWQFGRDGKKPKDENYVSKGEKLSLEQQDFKKEGEEEVCNKDGSRGKLQAIPLLIATQRGVIEMVKEILKTAPVAVLQMDSDGKNIVHLAAEYGQTHIYDHILKRRTMKSLFGRVDDKGNSALHLAASFNQKRPWSILGAALQMQSEIKWYKYIEKSMKPGFFAHYNRERLTSQEIFTDAHKDLIKEAREWLIGTSESCSVVAALIAAVAYNSATTVPGGNQKTGFPVFESQPAFQVFAMSSLIALCFSVTALVLFLSIFTSRFHELDFETKLPAKLIGGMTTLFVSIAANLVSFCAGHFYIIHNKLESKVSLYAILSFPAVAFFFMSHWRLYFELLRTSISGRPEGPGDLEYL